jgi:ADP-ribose pyrophosphatase YjhB (NUDIX family)
MKDYIKKIRAKLGNEKFIHPGARIIVENKNKEILIIERIDNGRLGIPAGSIEENETIEACIIREVKEETGLKIMGLEVIGISSNPDAETIEYKNGDKIQYFTIEFYSDNWEGIIKIQDKTEVKRAKFMGIEVIENLPKNELSAFESLVYYRKNQKIMLK